MEVEYTGRQVTITRALRALADEGLERISKILGKTASAKVVLTSEKYRHVAEVNVFAAKARAALFVALCESPSSMEVALREAMVTAEMQAIRYKSKLRTQKRQPKSEKLLEEPAVARGARNTLPVAAPAEPAQCRSKKQRQDPCAGGSGHGPLLSLPPAYSRAAHRSLGRCSCAAAHDARRGCKGSGVS